MAAYIQICDNINNGAVIEIPSEKNGTLLLSSVAAQYPGSVGLKFKSETGAWRGCRVEVSFLRYNSAFSCMRFHIFQRDIWLRRTRFLVS